MSILSIVTRKPDTAGVYVPRHRAPYDESIDRVRKNCTVVAARHSTDPASVRAVFPR